MLLRLFIILVLLPGPAPLAGPSIGERLKNVLGAKPNADEILHPEVAFTVDADVSTPGLIRLQWHIEDGYYLYRDKFAFTLGEGKALIDQAGIVIPAGTMKADPSFGSVAVNTGDPLISLPLRGDLQTQTPVTLDLRYQGCKEDSVCYPPISRQLSLVLPAVIPGAEAAEVDDTDGDTPPLRLSAQDSITQELKDSSLFLNMLAFFGFGLLLSLTPCVFPMVPILSGIIVGQGREITRGGAFRLSLAYVLAMALCYALLGVIAATFYINLQATFQNAWVIGLFSAVFVALALSMFGFYELQMPAALQSGVDAISRRQARGSLSGAALMGALSAIIVGPCVAPPLAGALLYISQTGNALLGGLALFAMGLGFGVPLLIIGSSAGSLLPKAGNWMETIKRVFGVLMLGVAIWFLERILPPSLSLLLWAALLVVSAVFLGALDAGKLHSGWQRLWKGLGIMLLVYGVILIIGAASGGSSIYRPLQGLALSGAAAGAHQPLPFRRIKTVAELEAALALAENEQRYVMLDFYADWCVVCKEMEEYTFSDAGVRARLDDFMLLQADVTRNDEQDRALLQRFSLYGPPAILFFAPDGSERQAHRLVGFVDAAVFTEHLLELGSSG